MFQTTNQPPMLVETQLFFGTFDTFKVSPLGRCVHLNGWPSLSPIRFALLGYTPLWTNTYHIRTVGCILWSIPIKLNIYIYISADPGLGQGRDGAWDHWRCGTCFVTAMALTLSKVVPATSACLCLSGFPSLKGLKRAAAAPTTYSGHCFSVFKQLHATAICF